MSNDWDGILHWRLVLFIEGALIITMVTKEGVYK
jgi:hypothetical protein